MNTKFWYDLMAAVDSEYMGKLNAQAAAIEEERKLRKAERDFARAAGWTGEAYWDDMDIKALRESVYGGQS